MDALADVVGWKRGWVRPATPGWQVAGEFAQSGVPLTATAYCATHQTPAPNRAADCWHGFSAYRTRLEAVRRSKAASTSILRVDLTGAHSPGPHWIGESQRLVAIDFPRLCSFCAADPVAVLGSSGPWPGGLVPACSTHLVGEVSYLEDVATHTSADVGWTSVDHGRWLRRLRQDAPEPVTRCPCARVSTVGLDHGLRHYFDVLWERDGPTDPDGSMPMRCRVCGQRWLYVRQTWPTIGRKMPV